MHTHAYSLHMYLYINYIEHRKLHREGGGGSVVKALAAQAKGSAFKSQEPM